MSSFARLIKGHVAGKSGKSKFQAKNSRPLGVQALKGLTVMHNPIIGKWSYQVLFNYYAMSDYVLTFLPDHTGYFEEINVELYAYETFFWTTSDDGTLSITATSRRFKLNDEEGTEPGTISMQGIPYLIQREAEYHCGELMDVLIFSLTPESPWEGFPDRFGRLYSVEHLSEYSDEPVFP